MRIDLFLKQPFVEVFDPTWNTIRWASVSFKPHHKVGIHPRVNSMISFVPKKYYPYMNSMKHDHDSWHNFIEHTKLTYDDLDMMLNTYHDADSEKDWNPIYYVVNRPETTVQHTMDLFDKRTFKDEV